MAYVEGEMPIYTGDNRNGAFGGSEVWWIVILFAMFFGWGGNGYGPNGSGATNGYILASDFSNIERKIDGVNNGICDGFFAMNTGMLNGFGTVNQNIMTNGYETRNAIQGLSSQMASCCCDIRQEIAGVNYNIANQFAQTNYNMAKNTCDIIQSSRDNTQRIIDYMTTEKIASLQAENVALKGQISQDAQTGTLLNAINRTPIPSYNVPNPYCCNQYTFSNSCSGSVL